MRKIYTLSSCNTCKRIIKELNNGEGFEIQDIKKNNISPEELDFVKASVGSYEKIFSRRAMKYRSMGLADQNLKEADYRELILGEYTFLKRPVIIIDGKVFTGNSKKTIEAALKHL